MSKTSDRSVRIKGDLYARLKADAGKIGCTVANLVRWRLWPATVPSDLNSVAKTIVSNRT